MPISTVISTLSAGFASLRRRLNDETAASMVEYALLVVLIAIVALVAVTVAGTELSENYSTIASGLTGANASN